MLRAYFDESGIQHDSPVCVVAGYFGRKKPWKQLASSWKQTLKIYGIREFHAKDFFARDDVGNRVGEYRDWSDAKANAFVDTLTSAVKHSQEIGPISCCLVKTAWNDLSYGERRFITGGLFRAGKFRSSGAPSRAYFVPFQYCVINTAYYCRSGQKLHFVFDLNQQLEGFAHDLYALLKGQYSDISVKDRLGVLSFADSAEAVPIQIADLFSYLTSTFCDWRLTGRPASSFPEDHLLRRMMANTRHKLNHQFLDRHGIEEVLAELPPAMREAFKHQITQKAIQEKRRR